MTPAKKGLSRSSDSDSRNQSNPIEGHMWTIIREMNTRAALYWKLSQKVILQIESELCDGTQQMHLVHESKHLGRTRKIDETRKTPGTIVRIRFTTWLLIGWSDMRRQDGERHTLAQDQSFSLPIGVGPCLSKQHFLHIFLVSKFICQPVSQTKKPEGPQMANMIRLHFKFTVDLEIFCVKISVKNYVQINMLPSQSGSKKDWCGAWVCLQYRLSKLLPHWRAFRTPRVQLLD